ncbi:MAG: toll/interleukin-1 receptor domain-containing protein, partial [Anaerolinea sp.]|nr:toll/interleukin-1 receptor domain-containing protein [Anaerolinea sp.]
MPLHRDQRNTIIDLLIPIVSTPDADRKALIRRAFYGEPVVEKIVYSGSAPTFADEVVEKLMMYNDEAAVIQLLKHIRDHEVGSDVRRKIDACIRAIAAPTADVRSSGSPSSTALDGYLFISYARKDSAFVERLRADLTARGIRYWIDRENLKPGTPQWERAIRAAIKDSRGVLWIVSPAAYESEFVDSEIAVAEMEKRTIYPIWADGDNWIACVPLGRHRIQYADMRGDAYSDGLKMLLEALGDPKSALIVPPGSTPEPP